MDENAAYRILLKRVMPLKNELSAKHKSWNGMITLLKHMNKLLFKLVSQILSLVLAPRYSKKNTHDIALQMEISMTNSTICMLHSSYRFDYYRIWIINWMKNSVSKSNEKSIYKSVRRSNQRPYP